MYRRAFVSSTKNKTPQKVTALLNAKGGITRLAIIFPAIILSDLPIIPSQ